MIIRSQDKKIIINFDSASSIYMQGTEIWANTYHGIAKLGTYSNEKKAIKVLDMICEYYQECKMCESGRRQIAQVEFVFQMPQDSEV